MSFWDRLGRVFEALDNNGIYGAEAYGLNGLIKGQSFLSEHSNYVYFDPIIPNRKGYPFSIPAIIWSRGSLFCIDFKRWKGSVEYEPITETQKIKKKFLFFEYISEEEIQVGVNKEKVVKRKVGNYNEDVFYKTFKNPQKKVKGYIYGLKSFLSKKNKKWERIYIHPVVVFVGNEINIGPIHSLKNGFIYLSELPEYLKYNQNDRFVDGPSQWILDGLKSLPTWDRCITRNDIPFQGVFEDNMILVDCGGKKKKIPLKDIDQIEINREDIFSDKDNLLIHLDNGDKIKATSKWQSINISFMNETTVHQIRNLSHINVNLSKYKEYFQKL